MLAFWNENDIFNKSVDRDAPKGDYVFYDGPPFATGLPHYGHIVASVIKDVVPRYWTMRGYRVPRVWGWDCHGLPIENIVEKELGFKHKKDIKEYGIAKFNERCREQVLTYAHEWEKIIPRIGRWADMKNAYRTMDKPFMESVWWVFKQIYDKGLVYEDYRSMHICPRCETTLSQTEVSEGYKDVKDISVTVKFELVDEPGTYLLAWTTTPWTLPGNVAIAVGADVEYVTAEREGVRYIVAKDRVEHVFDGQPFTIVATQKGSELVGKKYTPPFDYYINDTTLKNRENGWKVYAADFVTAESGTGIAHEAPAFGADDWELLKQVNLPFVQHVNMDGTMKPEVTDFAGLEAKPKSDDDKVRLGTDIAVLKYLQDHSTFFSKENITHSYPHCWRCDTPLLNYATSSWFVSVTKLKTDLLSHAKSINWSPEHIKEGRFGKWLEGARDWGISRQRFWASVIPIWVCEKCKEKKVFGSASELEEASGKKIDDLHKHVIDLVTVPCACGGTMKRVPDVLDTWFDSGSMPYGSQHYPFENKEKFDAAFPAQFIAEGQDQTRAWFYYLHVLGGALFNKNAFQNVIVNGIVLAEDGKKMSKRLQNYPDPMEVVERHGADALRMYLLSSPVMQAENLSFSERGVDEMAKKNLGRLNNVLSFYKLYEDSTPRDWQSEHVLDVWIVARLDSVIKEVTDAFEKYQLDSATRPISGFIDDLSVWYLRRSRDRFKEDGVDKKAALATIRFVLHRLALVMAPSAPFFAEYLFQAVKEGEDEESVHLAMWPEVSRKAGMWAKLFGGDDGRSVLEMMESARDIVTQALEARDKAGIKVRQPLASLSIPGTSRLSEALRSIIADEVNVKIVVPHGEGVVLDVTLTEALREDGMLRDVVREIQAFRKEQDLKPGAHVSSILSAPQAEIDILKTRTQELQKATNTTITKWVVGEKRSIELDK
ncbi:MAG: Isoleucyl-tRNA synthetase, isoleucyl-tRNA synthetase [Candidatus Kaiserbacteria bacterium]|nr:Isoleucyl-tRNA synthetase, isoleucyl-tRNA synthetase [Candidatus Kaiserbacteria bacterium]